MQVSTRNPLFLGWEETFKDIQTVKEEQQQKVDQVASERLPTSQKTERASILRRITQYCLDSFKGLLKIIQDFVNRLLGRNKPQTVEKTAEETRITNPQTISSEATQVVAPTAMVEPKKSPYKNLEPIHIFDLVEFAKDHPPLSADEIRKKLNEQMEVWGQNTIELGQRAESHVEIAKMPLFALNVDIFLSMKQADKDLETPLDFISAAKGHCQITPLPKNFKDGPSIQMLEGSFYTFDMQMGELNVCIGEDLLKTKYQGLLYRKENGKIVLYLGEGDVSINGAWYRGIKDRNPLEPICVLEAGDIIYDSNFAEYLAIDAEGNIKTCPKQREFYFSLSDASQQSQDFEEHLHRAPSDVSILSPFTSDPQAAVISEPLKNEFSFYGNVRERGQEPEHPIFSFGNSNDDKGPRNFVEKDKDIILSKLAAYFAKEFEVMSYTAQQKVFRLATFASFIFRINEEPFQEKGFGENHNYYLGEYLKVGWGEGRHTAVLLKFLADQLKINCTLIVGRIFEPNFESLQAVSRDDSSIEDRRFVGMSKETWFSAWNIAEADGDYYLLDGRRNLILPIGKNIPGKTPELQEGLLEMYSIKSFHNLRKGF